jgi:hypothetical protein
MAISQPPVPAQTDTGVANVSLPNEPGAKIVSIYAERKVKVFAIHEPELKTVSYLNTAATAGFAIGAFFLSNLISAPTAVQSIWMNPVTWATVLFFGSGIVATFFKQGILRDIKDQSNSRET